MITEIRELSFLDIQYIWENDSDIVLFVPESQYNAENIERFNKIKKSNCHLAIALDGYEAFCIHDYRLSFPCFLHGYYDLLLKKDYRIVACKRQHYSKELPKKLSLTAFKEQFAVNDRRLKLYNDFVRLVSIIRQYVKISKIMVAGSYIEDKENPGDMDLLISVDQEEFAKVEADRNLYHQYTMLIAKPVMKKIGFDLHVMVRIEKSVDLKSCRFEKHDVLADYLCQRGYDIALFSQKTVYHDVGYTCTIRNRIEIVI